jgi:hypothetical protein
MSNDAEAREVHATITDSGAPWEPVNGDEAEPEDRTDLVDEADADEDDEDEDEDEVIDADAVIIAEDSDEPGELDEADDDTDPAAVATEAIVVEPVTAEDTVVDPVPAEDTVVEPVPAEDTVVDAVPADTLAEPAPGPGSPKHAAVAAADPGAARPGMPVNGDVPEGLPMAGDPVQLHERWAAIQSTFVDDPRGSVTSAADLVTEAIATVVASAKERESGLRGDWDRDGVDTEGLRNALRSYRALLDQIAAL